VLRKNKKAAQKELPKGCTKDLVQPFIYYFNFLGGKGK